MNIKKNMLRYEKSLSKYATLDKDAKRLKEINNFCKTLKTEIYAIPDKSAIDVLGDSIGFYGEIYKYC